MELMVINTHIFRETKCNAILCDSKIEIMINSYFIHKISNNSFFTYKSIDKKGLKITFHCLSAWK